MAWVVPALILACTGITSGHDPVAIEFVSPPDTITVGDTVVLHLRALDKGGDSVAATFTLTSLDTAILGIDSTLGAVVGDSTGAGRVVARAGSLVSDPLRIIVAGP